MLKAVKISRAFIICMFTMMDTIIFSVEVYMIIIVQVIKIFGFRLAAMRPLKTH